MGTKNDIYALVSEIGEQLAQLSTGLDSMDLVHLHQLWWWVSEVACDEQQLSPDLSGDALVWVQRVCRLVELAMGARDQMEVAGVPMLAARESQANVTRIARGQQDAVDISEGQRAMAPFGVSLSLEMLDAIRASQESQGADRLEAVRKAQALATNPAHFWLVLMLPQEPQVQEAQDAGMEAHDGH